MRKVKSELEKEAMLRDQEDVQAYRTGNHGLEDKTK